MSPVMNASDPINMRICPMSVGTLKNQQIDVDAPPKRTRRRPSWMAFTDLVRPLKIPSTVPRIG